MWPPWPGAQFWSQLCHQTTVWLGESNLWGFYWLTHKVEATVPADQCEATCKYYTSTSVIACQCLLLTETGKITLILSLPFLMGQWGSLSHSQVEAFFFFQPPNYQEGNRSEHFGLWSDDGFLPTPRGSSGYPTIYGKTHEAVALSEPYAAFGGWRKLSVMFSNC